MALKGTLRDFGIGDIFQLIQQQQKAGILRMADRETEVRILFDGGKIVGAESTGAKQQKEQLGVLLVRAGLVTPEQLEKALALQSSTLRKLGDILIQQGAISKENLKSFLALQTRETINRLFRWRSGEYEFIPQPVKYDAEVATPMSPEHVLMDGFRMMDEWPAVAKTIHGLEAIPAVPKGAEEQIVRKAGKAEPGREGEEEDDGDDDLDAAFGGMGEGGSEAPREKKVKLTASQTVVFDLVDGKRTVQDIVDRSLLGEFNTSKALAELIEKGAAAIVGRRRVDDKGRIPVVERQRGAGLSLAFGLLLSLLALALSGAAVVVLGLGGRAAVSQRAFGDPSTGTFTDALAAHRI